MARDGTWTWKARGVRDPGGEDTGVPPGDPGTGRYFLYWMQASQRVEDNHVLEYAVDMADGLRLPLVVFFGLTDRYPGANRLHCPFMLEGLFAVAAALHKRGIRFVVRKVSPEKGALELSRDAALVVVERGYLRVQREWRRRLARGASCPLLQVDGEVAVPVQVASTKKEWAAATFRPKVRRNLLRFWRP